MLALGATAALCASMLAVPAASAVTGGTSSARTTVTTLYAIGKPLCGAAARGQARCFAMRRVLVPAGTPGARAFEAVTGGATRPRTSGPKATIGPNGGLTPFDLATAYGFNSSASVSSQTVVLVDAYNDPDINSNLQTFDSNYGLATC